MPREYIPDLYDESAPIGYTDDGRKTITWYKYDRTGHTEGLEGPRSRKMADPKVIVDDPNAPRRVVGVGSGEQAKGAYVGADPMARYKIREFPDENVAQLEPMILEQIAMESEASGMPNPFVGGPDAIKGWGKPKAFMPPDVDAYGKPLSEAQRNAMRELRYMMNDRAGAYYDVWSKDKAKYASDDEARAAWRAKKAAAKTAAKGGGK